jgi:hypothetical protein
MAKRVWLSSVESGLEVTKTDPVSIGLNVEVTVRAGEDGSTDGVWLNGNRSYDTDILIDDVVSYHSPDESVGREMFERLESCGGGSAL